MRALCSSCGFHHEVVRVLSGSSSEGHEDVYQVAPQEECERTLFSERDIFEARARFGQEAIVEDDGD